MIQCIKNELIYHVLQCRCNEKNSRNWLCSKCCYPCKKKNSWCSHFFPMIPHWNGSIWTIPGIPHVWSLCPGTSVSHEGCTAQAASMLQTQDSRIQNLQRTVVKGSQVLDGFGKMGGLKCLKGKHWYHCSTSTPTFQEKCWISGKWLGLHRLLQPIIGES